MDRGFLLLSQVKKSICQTTVEQLPPCKTNIYSRGHKDTVFLFLMIKKVFFEASRGIIKFIVVADALSYF